MSSSAPTVLSALSQSLYREMCARELEIRSQLLKYEDVLRAGGIWLTAPKAILNSHDLLENNNSKTIVTKVDNLQLFLEKTKVFIIEDKHAREGYFHAVRHSQVNQNPEIDKALAAIVVLLVKTKDFKAALQPESKASKPVMPVVPMRVQPRFKSKL